VCVVLGNIILTLLLAPPPFGRTLVGIYYCWYYFLRYVFRVFVFLFREVAQFYFLLAPRFFVLRPTHEFWTYIVLSGKQKNGSIILPEHFVYVTLRLFLRIGNQIGDQLNPIHIVPNSHVYCSRNRVFVCFGR